MWRIRLPASSEQHPGGAVVGGAGTAVQSAREEILDDETFTHDLFVQLVGPGRPLDWFGSRVSLFLLRFGADGRMPGCKLAVTATVPNIQDDTLLSQPRAILYLDIYHRFRINSGAYVPTALFSNVLYRPTCVFLHRFCSWQADVTVQLTPEDGVDDVTYNVINTLLEFIDSNPPKWQKWKEKANQAGIEWA